MKYRLSRMSVRDGVTKLTHHLIRTASSTYNIDERLIQRTIGEVSIVDVPAVNAKAKWLSNPGRCQICLYYGLPEFFDRITMPFASRVASADKYGEVSERPKYSIEASRTLARRLLTAFWDKTLSEMPTFDMLPLSDLQEAFAVQLVKSAVGFVIGHELGHVLSRIFPDSFSSELDWAQEVARRVGHGVDARVMPEDWSREILADVVGLRLNLRSVGTTEERILALAGAETFLVIAAYLERTSNQPNQPNNSIHPPSRIRLLVLRHLTKENATSVTAMGRAFEELAGTLFE